MKLFTQMLSPANGLRRIEKKGQFICKIYKLTVDVSLFLSIYHTGQLLRTLTTFIYWQKLIILVDDMEIMYLFLQEVVPSIIFLTFCSRVGNIDFSFADIIFTSSLTECVKVCVLIRIPWFAYITNLNLQNCS